MNKVECTIDEPLLYGEIERKVRDKLSMDPFPSIFGLKRKKKVQNFF